MIHTAQLHIVLLPVNYNPIEHTFQMCRKLTVTSGEIQYFTKGCFSKIGCFPGSQGENRKVECCDDFVCNAPATPINVGAVHQPLGEGNYPLMSLLYV